MDRVIIIGDVHGCYKALMNLLSKISFKPEKDKIIFLGDLIDRGDESYEVFQYVKSLKEQMGDRCIILMGNHEHMFLNNHLSWYYNGAFSTIESFKNHDADIDDYKDFIKENMIFYYKDDNIQCCHAGLEDEIEKSDEYELIWNRDAFKLGLYDGKTTIVGHTPVKNPCRTYKQENGIGDMEIYRYNKKYDYPEIGLINIDTGCVFGKHLSAMIYYPWQNSFVFHKSEEQKLWTEE